MVGDEPFAVEHLPVATLVAAESLPHLLNAAALGVTRYWRVGDDRTAQRASGVRIRAKCDAAGRKGRSEQPSFQNGVGGKSQDRPPDEILRGELVLD